MTDNPLTAKQSKNLWTEWEQEIAAYESDTESWVSRSEKIIDRYRDSRKMRQETRSIRYNILWANVQVMRPALYARDPIPRVQRRFKQKDAPSRVGAEVVQNCLSYLIECGNFGDAMRAAVLDRLLSGRGTVWIRYEPTFEDVTTQTTDDVTGEVREETQQQLKYEKALPDYVHWKDMGHTFARTWDEMRGVWRITYLDRDALVARFGDKGKDIPLTHTPNEDESRSGKKKGTEQDKKAVIYEIWDKDSKRAIWLCKEYKDGVLDVRQDPLEIEGFFPCPKPLYATLANDDLVPTPDYVMYQDQASELDELTERISLIVSAVRVAGVYDASAPGIGRLLTEGKADNRLIAVSNWAMFAERGGLKSAMDLLPVLQIAQTLQQLYQSRDALKADIYEITGMSDIIRGATNPNETAKAQEIKSQYVNLRLNESQKDVERFARDLLRIMADLVSSKFSLQTLSNMSGVVLLNDAEKQKIMQMQQMAQQMQQTGQPAPAVPPEALEMLDKPTWEEVASVLRDDQVRNFKIEVETDSTIAINDKDEKDGINEFMMAMGQYMQGVTIAVEKGALPKEAGKQILLTVMRKYRFGDEVEEAFEAPDNTPPPVDPAMQKKEQELQQQQEELDKAVKQFQDDQSKFKTEVESANASFETQKQSFEAEKQIASQTAQSDYKTMEAEFQAQVKGILADFNAEQKIAQADAKTAVSQIQLAVEGFMTKAKASADEAKKTHDADAMQGIAEANNQVVEIANAAIDSIAQANQPKTVDVIRDPATGRPSQLVVRTNGSAKNANQ